MHRFERIKVDRRGKGFAGRFDLLDAIQAKETLPLSQMTVANRVPGSLVIDDAIRIEYAFGDLRTGRMVVQSHTPPGLESRTECSDRENRGDDAKRAIFEDHRLFDGLDLRTRRFRKHPHHFRQDSLKGRRGLRKPLLTCHHQAQGQRQRLLLREDERRQFVPRSQTIGSIATSFRFHRNAEVQQHLNIIPHGANVDLQPSSQFCAGHASVGLQEF